MKYNTFIKEGVTDTKHVYRFTPEKKLSEKITAMAGVEVYDLQGKKIGGYAFTRTPKNAFDRQVVDMVNELIRDYYTRKIWQKVGATK